MCDVSNHLDSGTRLRSMGSTSKVILVLGRLGDTPSHHRDVASAIADWVRILPFYVPTSDKGARKPTSGAKMSHKVA